MTTEDRLRAALTARSEQVQPEDLSPATTPTPARPSWRRPALYVAAAAAVAAAVVVPVAITHNQSDPVPANRPTPSPTPTPPDTTEDLPGADWRIAARGKAATAVGTARVRVRAEGKDEFDLGPRLRVEVGSAATLIDSGGLSFELADPIDVDGDGDLEIVISREGFDPQLAVLDLTEGGELVELAQSDAAPLTRKPLLPGSGANDRAYDTGWYVENRTLFSYRSVATYPLGSHSFEVPKNYPTRLWAWFAEPGGATLVPVEREADCIRGEGGTATCEASETTARFFPAADTLSEGDSFTSDRGPEVALVDTPGGADVVVVDSSGTLGLLISSQLPLLMDDRSPEVGQGEEVAVLVQSEGADSSGLTLVLTRDDGLIKVKVASEIPLGSGFIEEVTRYVSWVGPDGSLYTRVGPTLGQKGRASEVYRWRLQETSNGPRLVTEPVGAFCFEGTVEPFTVTRCD